MLKIVVTATQNKLLTIVEGLEDSVLIASGEDVLLVIKKVHTNRNRIELKRFQRLINQITIGIIITVDRVTPNDFKNKDSLSIQTMFW